MLSSNTYKCIFEDRKNNMIEIKMICLSVYKLSDHSFPITQIIRTYPNCVGVTHNALEIKSNKLCTFLKHKKGKLNLYIVMIVSLTSKLNFLQQHYRTSILIALTTRPRLLKENQLFFTKQRHYPRVKYSLKFCGKPTIFDSVNYTLKQVSRSE